MLVLSRKINQSIIIDGNIIVKIVGVVQGEVKVGVEAPKALKVDRQEIHEALHRQHGRCDAIEHAAPGRGVPPTTVAAAPRRREPGDRNR